MVIFILQSLLSTAVHIIIKFPVYEILLKLKDDFWKLIGFFWWKYRKTSYSRGEGSNIADADETGNLDSISYCQLICCCFDDIHPDFLNTIKKLCIGKLVSPW